MLPVHDDHGHGVRRPDTEDGGEGDDEGPRGQLGADGEEVEETRHRHRAGDGHVRHFDPVVVGLDVVRHRKDPSSASAKPRWLHGRGYGVVGSGGRGVVGLWGCGVVGLWGRGILGLCGRVRDINIFIIVGGSVSPATSRETTRYALRWVALSRRPPRGFS